MTGIHQESFPRDHDGGGYADNAHEAIIPLLWGQSTLHLTPRQTCPSYLELLLLSNQCHFMIIAAQKTLDLNLRSRFGALQAESRRRDINVFMMLVESVVHDSRVKCRIFETEPQELQVGDARSYR